jgi:hypothetical protein
MIRSAQINATERFIDFKSVVSVSGCYSNCVDHLGHHEAMVPGSDAELGEALLRCLARNRYVEGPEYAIIAQQVSDPAFTAWREQLRQRFGYTSVKAMLSRLTACDADQDEAGIRIAPLRKVGRDSWEGIKGAKLTLPTDATAEAIGAALRELGAVR